jgi:uncharacterized NAD-dependent epimerase/dehydratase family protein
VRLPQPYLLFLGDVGDRSYAKTALGLRDWAPQLCVGEMALPGASVSTGLTGMTPTQAYAAGARALVIGIAAPGGQLKPQWLPALKEALEAGLDIVSGMHTRLAESPDLERLARRLGRQLIDVRTPPRNIPIGSGRRRSGKRLLTVGTDCALGKKYTALALARAFGRQSVDVTFRATGQTGIMIAGEGIPIDAVVADFIAGAAEMLSPDAPDHHWDVIEGQGTVFHPSYAGVSLGLLHGSQPDVLVLCHEIGRDRIYGLEDFATPNVREAIDLHLTLARRTNPRARFAGISLNTASLDEERARHTLQQYARDYGMPVADPLREGPELDGLIAACLG